MELIFKTRQKFANPTAAPARIPNFPLMGARHVEKNIVMAKALKDTPFPKRTNASQTPSMMGRIFFICFPNPEKASIAHRPDKINPLIKGNNIKIRIREKNPRIPIFIRTTGNPSVTVKSLTSLPECV